MTSAWVGGLGGFFLLLVVCVREVGSGSASQPGSVWDLIWDEACTAAQAQQTHSLDWALAHR
jgi:hypothetical protein